MNEEFYNREEKILLEMLRLALRAGRGKRSGEQMPQGDGARGKRSGEQMPQGDGTRGKRSGEQVLRERECALPDGRFQAGNLAEDAADCNADVLLALADRHAVYGVIYDVVEDLGFLSPSQTEDYERRCRVLAVSNYRLLFLTKYVTGLLRENGITALTLKGCATALLYPVPELRKSGDVDLLVPDADEYARALDLLKQDGFAVPQGRQAAHHTELLGPDGIVVELHGMLAEPFENRRINAYLDSLLPEFRKHVCACEGWGVPLLQPQEAYHAFYLVVHMLQHYLREGFGLKNLCDWTVFWNREVPQDVKETFLRLVQESGTAGFVGLLTASCVRWMGLDESHVDFLLKEPVQEELADAFLRDVLDAGEFGLSQQGRMVAMRGTGLFSYVREFHHQMHLNYPGAGRVFVLWPALWALTLARFLKNNKNVRGGVSGREILKKAGARSRLVRQMNLFEK